MTRNLLFRLIPGIPLITFLFSGCMRDKVSHRYTFERPVYQTLTQARLAMKSSPPQNLSITGKIAVYKNYLLVSDYSSGIHIFDNSNPSAPVNLSFIPVFGNTDIAISNDIMYANDGFSDLVAFSIADPANVKPVRIIPAMFNSGPDTIGNASYFSPDSFLVVTGYVKVDTTIYGETPEWDGPTNCAYCAMPVYNSAAPAANTAAQGTSGSTSSFAIKGNYLYCLNGAPYLDVIDISTASAPKPVTMTALDGYYQTLFSLNDHLFMGSTLGMFVYDATDPLHITKGGYFSHVQSCDPVIADGDYAFVTAWSGSACGGATNELDVLDVSNIESPGLRNSYQLSNPRGLAKDGDILLICDGKKGLGTFKVSDGSKVVALHSAEAMETNDVIAANGLAIVTGTDGIYQYSYTTEGSLKKLSKIPLSEKK